MEDKKLDQLLKRLFYHLNSDDMEVLLTGLDTVHDQIYEALALEYRVRYPANARRFFGPLDDHKS